MDLTMAAYMSFKKDLDKQLACQQFGGVWHIFRG